MLLAFHVTIALLSVLFSAYLFFRPTKTRLGISGGLITATIASGTYLIISTKAPMLQACVSGLLYVGTVLVINLAAVHKLSKNEAEI